MVGQHGAVTVQERTAHAAVNFDQNQSVSMKAPTGALPRRSHTFTVLAAVACTVLGAKLIAISAFGSPTPLVDQWDGEAANLYSPYLNGTLSFADLFAAHNEHRIFLTRVLTLAHLELAGEWNTRLEMILCAILHTALVGCLTALLIPLVAPRRRTLFVCFVAFLFVFPIGYENTLLGFNFHFYLTLLFGVASLAAFAAAGPFSWRWFGGLVAAVLSYLSLASGVATILAAAVLVGLQMATNARKRCGREYAGAVVMASIAVAMMLSEASIAKPMSSMWTFIQGLLLLAAMTIAGLVPTVWFTRQTLARHPAILDRAWVAVGIAGWVAAQLVLVAYGRGTAIAVRYMDIVLLVYPLGSVAVFAFVDKVHAGRLSRLVRPGAVAWGLCVVAAFAAAGYASVLGSTAWRTSAHQQLVNVQAYFATGNVDKLKVKGDPGLKADLTYPNPQRLAAVLRDPAVRAILPREIRPADADNAWARNRMWLKGSLAGATAAAVRLALQAGPILVGLGVALLFAVAARGRIRAARGLRHMTSRDLTQHDDADSAAPCVPSRLMPNSGWFIRLAPRVVRSAVRRRCSAAADISPRALLLSSVLLMSALSAAICFVLAQYFSVDTFSSLVYLPDDCWLDWGMNVGRHCFSDYAMPVTVGALPNPWKPYPLFMYPDYRPFMNNYPAAGMVPQMTFALLGKGLGAPRIGLFGYLLVLAIAVVSPAWWAARGARGLDRIVVFVACGVAAVPAWTTVDRGNSVGFFVPIALVCLVALRRQRWGLVAIMVVLAALIKPQFGILAVALLAARKWRLGGITIGGGLICNLGAYALWPADFPATVMQSVHNTLGYGSPSSSMGLLNVSFAKGLLAIPDGIEGLRSGGTLPNGFLAGPRSVLGYAILVLVVGSILLLGRRIPPVVVGIALLAAVSLFPAVTNSYYLVFVLPVAAVLIRDPSGASGCGIFDRLEPLATPRRTVGICVSLATALSIAQVAAPCAPFQMLTLGPGGAVVGTTAVVRTSVVLAPIFWLIACAVIIISFARRPAVGDQVDIVTASMPAESTLAAAGHPRPSGLDLGPPQAAATSNPT